MKDALEKKKAEKRAKEERKEENKIKKARLQMQKGKTKAIKQKNKETNDEKKKGVRFLHFDSFSDDDDSEQDELCVICNEYGKTETWYACSICRKWVRAECSGLALADSKQKAYVCYFCS